MASIRRKCGLSPSTIFSRTGPFLMLMLLAYLPTSSASPLRRSTQSAPSHMQFLMATEVQILPKTELLAERVESLLRGECEDFNKSKSWTMSECFNYSKNLKSLSHMETFPSQSALDKEGTKMFTKHLFKDAHKTMTKLERMLSHEGKTDPEIGNVVQEISELRQIIGEQVVSYFGGKLSNLGQLRKAKKHYKQEDYRLKLFYTAWERFKQMNFVLGYAARLSWSDANATASRS